jgi:hypothetical protein
MIREQRWDEVAARIAPGFVWESRHTHALGSRRTDKAGFVRGLPFAFEAFSRLRHDPQAVRGEDLALYRSIAMTDDTEPGAPRQDGYIVQETCDEGLIVMIGFDGDQRADAYAEIDRRYLAGEAAPHADVYRVARTSVHAAPTAFAPDVVLNDHRKGSAFDVSSRDAMLASARDKTRALERPEGGIVAVHALNERGAVIQTVVKETADDANAVEFGGITVRFVQNGRIVRQDAFDDDQLDEALAFFATHREPAYLENACTRSSERWAHAIMGGRLDELETLATPDFVAERRIANELHPSRMDIHEFKEWARTSRDTGFQTGSMETLATRGETLALFRINVRTDSDPSAFDYGMLLIREVSSEGLAKRLVYFGPDDLESAMSMLDELHLASSPERHGDQA